MFLLIMSSWWKIYKNINFKVKTDIPFKINNFYKSPDCIDFCNFFAISSSLSIFILPSTLQILIQCLSKSTREVWEISSGFILSEGKIPSLHLLVGEREWATSQTANIGGDRMNLGIRIFPLPNSNGLLGGRMSKQRSEQLLVLRMGNYPCRRMNRKLGNSMKLWKGSENITTLLFSLKDLQFYIKNEEDKCTP